jgi:hypothetical protein
LSRISAYRASEKFGLKLWTLCGAIDSGLVPADVGEVRMAGARRRYMVGEAQLAAWLESRRGRECGYPGCDTEALVFSDRCFSHTGGVTLPGHAPRDSEERIRMAAGKVGLERPDVAERYRHDWRRGGPLTRGLFYDGDGKVKPYFKGSTRQAHLGRQNATKPPAPGGRPRGRERLVATDGQKAEIEKLAAAGWGRRAIANRLQLSERLVRNILTP